jgi:hypothetical protein
LTSDEERDLDLLEAVISAYYDRHTTGGSFHVALDDGNCSRSTFEWCTKQAEKSGDLIGAAIGKLLLRAPDHILAEFEYGTMMAFVVWRDLIQKQDQMKRSGS